MTPSRAMYLFVALLGIAIVLLFRTESANLPAAPVLVYGIVLFIAQRLGKSREFTTTVKDSPYFLGFLLTLLGLFKIFFDIGATGSDLSAPVAVPRLVGQAGGAILATVIGLFFRQVLWSYDKVENQREAVFQDLSRSLRDQAVSYQEQQTALVSLISDFVESRQRILAEEEAAHARYLEHLTQTSDVLDRFNAEYPEKLAAVLEGLVNSGATITRGSTELANSVRKAGEDLSRTYDEQSKLFVTAITTASAPIGEAGRRVSLTVNEFENLLGDGSKRIGEALEKFASSVGETPASLKETANSLQSLRGNAQGLDEAVKSVIGSATTINSAVAALVQGLADDSDQIHTDIRNRSDTLRQDIADVDRAFDELMALMRQRLLANDVRLNATPDGRTGG